MTEIIRAMNPAAPLNTEGAARAAARVSAVGMIIGAVSTAVSAWYASTPAATEAAAGVIEELTGQAPSAAQLASQAQMGLYFGIGLAVLQLILAVVQWRKPNVALPIIFLVLVVWGLGSSALAMTMPAMSGGQPVWLTAFTVASMLIAAILHIAGIRGASALAKFRAAQAY